MERPSRSLRTIPHRAASIALACLCLIASPAAAADDTDVVMTKAGTRLVGEIKQMEKDVLTLSTSYDDADFAIKWEEITSVESTRQFLLETYSGLRLAGTLQPGVAQGATVIVGGASIPLKDVWRLRPFETSFFSRFDAGFDVGYAMVAANNAKQLSVGGRLAYRSDRSVDSLVLNLFRSSQDDAARSERAELGNDYRYLLGRHWFTTATQDFLRSSEQALDLRSTLGGGVGRYLWFTSDQYVAVAGGLAWTRENYEDASIPTQNSADAYLGAELMTEKLRFADLLTRFTYYPSLTIDGRYRVTFKFDLDFNLPGDWYFRAGVYDNFDSAPPDALSKNDWGWSNSFGLKF